MKALDYLLQTLFKNQAIITALSAFIIAVLGYMHQVIKNKFTRLEKENVEIIESQDSIKRISLRNEYLQIYNSNVFTNEQKYRMSRKIIQDYFDLKGNSYVAEIDQELKFKAEVMPDEIER